MIELAAMVYALATLVVVLFQFALVAGAPWGHLTMGGRIKGTLPLWMRGPVLLQAILLALFAVWMCDAGSLLVSYTGEGSWFALVSARPEIGVWIVVGVSAVSLLMNLITPSPGERRLWAPIAFVMLISSTTVALLS